MKISKKSLKILIFIFTLSVFSIILYGVVKNSLVNFDTKIYNIINHNSSHKDLMICITYLAEPTTLIILTGVLILALRDKKLSLIIPMNLLLVVGINKSIKHLVRRSRPIDINLITQGGYSFPSGHTMSAAAFYGILIYIIHNRISNVYLKWLYITILFITIILVGISRIYLGVHYASDVIAGLAVTIAYLIILTSIPSVKRRIRK